MSPLTRLTDIQLSLIHVNPLSDVPILDTLMSFAYVRRHASFPLASHLAVSSNAVRVGYTVVRFNRVRIELTFYHYSLKRTHNLGLEGGPNFRWQYSLLVRLEFSPSGSQSALGGYGHNFEELGESVFVETSHFVEVEAGPEESYFVY